MINIAGSEQMLWSQLNNNSKIALTEKSHKSFRIIV